MVIICNKLPKLASFQWLQMAISISVEMGIEASKEVRGGLLPFDYFSTCRGSFNLVASAVSFIFLIRSSDNQHSPSVF